MNEIALIVDGTTYRVTDRGNNNKYARALKDAGPKASPKQVLAHYDKHAGYIQDESGKKVENGSFWAEEKARLDRLPDELRHKTNEELQEIMRNSIDNAYVPSSIHHKARLELEFRNSQPEPSKPEEILKLAPEFHGVGVDLKALWRKTWSWFKK